MSDRFNLADIRQRANVGKNQHKAMYMIIWCDTYDYSEYAGYYATEEEAQFALDFPDSMQRAMECYDLNGDIEEQLRKPRAWALKRQRF